MKRMHRNAIRERYGYYERGRSAVRQVEFAERVLRMVIQDLAEGEVEKARVNASAVEKILLQVCNRAEEGKVVERALWGLEVQRKHAREQRT